MGLLNKKPANQHELFAGKNASSRSSNTESDASSMVLREERSSGGGKPSKTTDSGKNQNQVSSSPKEASGSEGLIDVSRSQHAIGAGLDHIGERDLLGSNSRELAPKDISESVGDGLGEASRMQGNSLRDKWSPHQTSEEESNRQRHF